MKTLSIVVAAMFLAGCSGMGMHGASGSGGTSGGMSGTGGSGVDYRSSTAPFDPADPHHGG
jgi:hypothetical protein